MMKKRKIIPILIFLSSCKLLQAQTNSVDKYLSQHFSNSFDKNTSFMLFQSLNFPITGKQLYSGPSLGGKNFDISFMQINPALSCIQDETQFSIFHNSLENQILQESLGFTSRNEKFRHLAYGFYFSSFYSPFQIKNNPGEVHNSLYSETVFNFNLSYNFLAAYDFKGLALGINIKSIWKHIPENSSVEEIKHEISDSILGKNSLGLYGDLGLLSQFNFLKFFISRNPNLQLGFSVKNLGLSLENFPKGNIKNLNQISYFQFDLSYEILKNLSLGFEYKNPFSISNKKVLEDASLGFGLNFFLNPKLQIVSSYQYNSLSKNLNLGLSYEYKKVILDFNYNLNLNSAGNKHRLSFSSNFLLGDKGRKDIDAEVDRLYKAGLSFYGENKWEEAIKIWEEALKLNKRFDPAILGIQSARYQILMLKKIKESMIF